MLLAHTEIAHCCVMLYVCIVSGRRCKLQATATIYFICMARRENGEGVDKGLTAAPVTAVSCQSGLILCAPHAGQEHALAVAHFLHHLCTRSFARPARPPPSHSEQNDECCPNDSFLFYQAAQSCGAQPTSETAAGCNGF